MPTTRSRKRPSEALASLPEPAKRQRKRRTLVTPRIPSISPDRDEDFKFFEEQESRPTSAQTIPVLAVPESSIPLYVDAAAQTVGELYVLTHAKLDAMIDEAVERKIASNKRLRDEEDTFNTPNAKRINLTPTSNSGYGFLFNRLPNTAPAKSSFRSATPGRIFRGPISSRNVTPMNKHRKLPSHATARKSHTRKQPPTELRPVEVATPPPHLVNAQQSNSGSSNANSDPNTSPSASQPAQRSLFGSLRGLAQSGFDFAMNLSPLRHHSTMPRSEHTRNQSNRFSSDQESPEEEKEEEKEEEETRSPNNDNADEDIAVRPALASTQQVRQADPTLKQSTPPTQRRPSRYDHLHYIKPGSDEERRLAAGEWVPPPRAPTPPDEFEIAKERNPSMPDWMIENLLAKRARRRAMQGEASEAASEPPKIAPLFGPDSHYARGTVDPRFISPKSYRMHAKYPSLIGGSAGSKRSYELFETSQNQANLDLQPTVEDAEDQDESSQETPAESTIPETPLAKKQKLALPVTPRSALKNKNDPAGSIGRSGRSVNFNANPVSGSRGLRAHYGPAGQYKGSTFADLSSPTSHDESSLSSIGHDDLVSPTTQLNTLANLRATRIQEIEALEKNFGAGIPDIDFTLRDPNDSKWRPSLTNPRPGVFRVPDVDEESDSDEESEGTGDTETITVPPQPSTPRMSHAELPATSASTANNETAFNESSIQFESTELAIEKARSKAQKYKPKDSSRLSEVSLSHSRSPSPDSDETPRANKISAPAVQPVSNLVQTWKSRKPYAEAPLDKTIRGEDGRTDYEREHQYDGWAAQLNWDNSKSYEDAGTGTKEIHDLIRKNWTEEDSRRSEEFWQREFDEIDILQKKAKARGQLLHFLTGMEDADHYMNEQI